jgi:hypothetical protein
MHYAISQLPEVLGRYCTKSYVDRVVHDVVSWVPAAFTLQITNSCRVSSSVALGLDLQRC